MPRVSVILVARDGDDAGERALEHQTRPPDAVVVVSAGRSLERAVAGLPSDGADEWVWLLPADARPAPDALARLLAAVEVRPSVVIAGPKLVDHDDATLIRSFGESITHYGTTVALADDELDQSQHDVDDDVLGVVLPGMLIRRAMWDLLGGPDRGLPTVDAGLDLSIRARLTGARVVRVPAARVAVAPGVQDFARRRPLGTVGRVRARRAAQLHRRLAYAPGAVVPFHWLSLLPLAVLRVLVLLLGKRPAAIPGEFGGSLAAIFDASVLAARRRIRRTRRVGWSAIAPLRLTPDVVRERRASAEDREHARTSPGDLVRARFVPGGLAVTVVGAVLGLLLSVRLLGASALAGGALLPLPTDLGALWANLGWAPRDGLGLSGPADPFHAVLAVLGSLAPWAPSSALVALWVAAPALAALAAWWFATRLSTRAWPPVLAATLWMLAPPFLAALVEGRPAAVLVHVLLPWLLLAVLEAPRSWSAAGAAGLLFAAVVACSPVLTPVLVVAVVAWALAHPRQIVRLLAVPLPALALAAPLLAAQLARGTPLGLLADPGPVVASTVPDGWQLLLGAPSAAAAGWDALLEFAGLPGILATPLSIALLAPLAAVALLALFLPGARRAVPAAFLTLGGLLTAVLAAHLAPASAGAAAVTIWPGGALSVSWIGLVAAVVIALGALRRVAVGVGVAILLSATVAVAPALVTLSTGQGAVVPSDGRVLPAIVAAEAAGDPTLGTLVLRPQADGSLAATVARGAGTTLEGPSTFAATRPVASDAQLELAELAGNLASRGGFDPTPALDRFGIEFVVLVGAEGGAAADIRDRAAEALDAQPALVPIGDTVRGSLRRYPEHASGPPAADPPSIEPLVLAGQAVIIGFAALLALPTGIRRRRLAAAPDDDELEVTDDGFDDDGFGGDDRG